MTVLQISMCAVGLVLLVGLVVLVIAAHRLP